MTKLYLQT